MKFRTLKELEQKNTKSKAAVPMSTWVVKQQNDYLEDNNQYFIDNEYCYYY